MGLRDRLLLDFSPDGTRIGFAGMEPGATDADVFVIGTDGTGLVQLTSSPANDRYPAWSPDGSHIAFVSDRTGTAQIWVMNADGSDQHQLTFDLTARIKCRTGARTAR